MVTLAEVAKHAGVTASTVSYVISGKRSISPRTRERVERSIHELGYHRGAGARARVGGRPGIIALMMPPRTGSHVSMVMETAIAVTTTARTYGYDVLLPAGEEGSTAVRRVIGNGLADALILMDVAPEDERLPLLRESGRAVVLIGLPVDTTGLTCVDPDFAATGALCAEHLAGLGHRDIAVLGAPPAAHERHTGSAARTLDGLRAKSRELGLGMLHRPSEAGHASMARTLARVFDERPGTSGFVVRDESAVEPLLAALREQGRAVPEDVSVVAICSDRVALRSSVRLTSVSVPAAELGRRAVDRIIAELGGEGGHDVALIAPELTVRASSGRAPA